MTFEWRHVLYRLFDQDGGLLYVGITHNMALRFRTHAKERPWWTDVASHSVEYFPTRTDLETAEREVIRSEVPRHNVMHSTVRATPRGRATPPMQRRPPTNPRLDVLAITNPVDRIRVVHDAFGELAATRSELAEIKRGAVREMRAGGLTFKQVAEQLGLSRSRTHTLAADRSRHRPQLDGSGGDEAAVDAGDDTVDDVGTFDAHTQIVGRLEHADP